MNIVYNNYFSGSILQVSECLEIIIYNRFEFKDRISLYNLESFYLKNLVGTSEKFFRIYRQDKNPDTPFRYKKLLKEGFNIIVYISNVSGSPLGYTEFVNTQGVGVSLDIFLEVGGEYNGDLGVIIQNQLAGKNLSRRFQGKEIYDYATIKDIRDREYRNLFTSDVGRVENDIYSFILGTSGIITRRESWKIRANFGLTIDSNLTNYNICFYNGVIMLAAWKNNVYSLYPLLTQEDAISGRIRNSGIKKIVGRYYIDTENNIRDLITEEIQEKTGKTQFCDYLDQKCKVYNLPVFYSISPILKYIPEINNIYLDLDNYLKSTPVMIHSKIGPWFILQRDFGGAYIYTAVSPTSVINLSEEDLDNIIFVGDQTMILCDKGDSDHSPYYMIYNSFGTELSTEKAREILYNGRLGWWEETGNIDDEFFKFCYLDTEEDESHFEEYFGDNGLVSIVYQYESLENTKLGRYRRNFYPNLQGIPELIGSYGGLIFYKYGTKINYL